MPDPILNEFPTLRLGHAIITTIIFTLIYATFAAGSKYNKKLSILLVGLFSVILIFASGAYIGTYHSATMEIPGWAFGLGINAVGFLLGLIVIWFWPTNNASVPPILAPSFLSLAGSITIILFAISINYAAYQFFTQQTVGLLFIVFHLVVNVAVIISSFACRKAQLWSVYVIAVTFLVYVIGSAVYINIAVDTINIWTTLKFIYLTIVPALILTFFIVKWKLLMRRYRLATQTSNAQGANPAAH